MSRLDVIGCEVAIASALARSWCRLCDCRFRLAYRIAVHLVERPRASWGRA